MFPSISWTILFRFGRIFNHREGEIQTLNSSFVYISVAPFTNASVELKEIRSSFFFFLLPVLDSDLPLPC